MSLAQDNPEPPPAVCSACGYDMTGVMHATCPECGADVVAERARLGMRLSALLVVLPLVPQMLFWWLAMGMDEVFCREYGLDPSQSEWGFWFLLLFAVHGVFLMTSVACARRFARAPFRTQIIFFWLVWLLFLPPMVLLIMVVQ